MRRPTVLLADDHTLLLDAFRKLLEGTCDVVGTVTDGHTLVKAAEELEPDVILVDVAMPHLNGLDACERIRQRVPRTKVIFLTMDEDPDTAAEAMRRGASGYLLKASAASELFEAIGQVLDGKIYVAPSIARGPVGVFVSHAERGKGSGLTLRQREVLQLLAEGKSMKEAADILEVTPRTIAFHKYSMMEHLGLKTTAELVQHAVTLGLVRPPASRDASSS
jgi:DNA-binding NarL/FixJ family response regulator